jgi:small-conductance mechanosensitive channel
MAAPFRSAFRPVPRLGWLAQAILVAAVSLILPGRSRPAEPRADDKARPAPAKKVELQRLTNEELLKQADALYARASRDYLAQFRALAFADMLLTEVRTQTDALKVAAPGAARSAAVQPPGEKEARKAVDAARARQELVRRKLNLVQTQKQLLDQVTTGLEGCRSAVVAFQNALDDLKAYALESSLRVKDGSLAGDKLPDGLKPEFLETKRRTLSDDLARLKTKSAEVQKGQEAVARLLGEVNKTLLAADADVVEASKNLVREQKRHELEKSYAGKKPAALIAELARMVEDGIGLKGTYELALRKFDTRTRRAAHLRKELEALRQPEAKIPQLTRAEDVTTAAKSIQALIRFHAARAKKIAELRTALAVQVEEGGEFEADAAVSEEHLFKMQVLANLLKKNGVPDRKLPEKARAAALDPAAARQKKSASAVRAATEKAKAELVLLGRQREEAAAASEAAAKQLANLKESQHVTLAALKWEGRLKGMTAAQVVKAFTTTHKQLEDRLGKLKGEAAGYNKAAAAVSEARARLDGLKDPFLRAAEEQGQAEKQKLLGELRKDAGLERATKPAATAPSPRPLSSEGKRGRGEGAAAPKKTDPASKPPPDSRTELEKVTERLNAFQQLLAGRVRVLDEREAKKKDLLAALDELKKKATVYSQTLADARLLALQLNATAVDLKKRFGKGDLPGDALPDGLTDALRLEMRTRLDATSTSVLNALNNLQQERDKLRQRDPDGEALAAATKELLTVVGKRLDLLADLKRLAAEYNRGKSARSPSESKRLDQRAAERLDAESTGWDTVLGLDSSKSAKNLSELLEASYRELIEIEDHEANLKKQRQQVEQLVELTRRETAVLTRTLPLLAKQSSRLEAAREEEAVLARARLRPDRSEELLKAYQTKTGRLLARPLPVADKEKAEKVEEIGNLLFERYVTLEAARKWEEVLNARAAPTGVKVEAGVYQDELARMNAASAANERRVEALTGRKKPGPATGGEIGQARTELARVRTQGVKRIALKIAAILLAALLLPRLLVAVLRRVFGGASRDDSSLVFSALRALLRAAVWVAAVTMILSTLGFNVTAILAGLGIGGLAIGLAAQPMIADVLGAVVIFAERRFRSGDVIRIGADDPARVVGLTWRSTQVKNSDGLVVTIPNRKVTEATIQNLTRAGETYDNLNVSVTTQKEVAKVLAVIQRAMAECADLAADHGVSVKEFNQKGETKTIKYRFWWFLRDYEARNRTRDEVFARISASLAHEDMVGTEISLA